MTCTIYILAPSEEQVDAILDYIEYTGITYCTFEEDMEINTH